MRDVLYKDNTKVKDLTVGELKDIIMECVLSVRSYNVPLNCIGKEFTFTKGATEDVPKL